MAHERRTRQPNHFERARPSLVPRPSPRACARRWGRNQEVPSEDPFINGMFGAQYTAGIQSSPDPRFLSAIVTLK